MTGTTVDRKDKGSTIKLVVPWALLAFGLFLVVFNKVTGENVFPVYRYGDITDYTFWQIPLVYVLNYITRAWPTLLFAFMVAGVLTSVVPRERLKKYTSSKKIQSYFAAAIFAPVLTVCSCAMIPIFGGLVIAGAGVGPAVTFLLMAPAANFLAILFTMDVISVEIAVARVAFAFFGAVVIGWIVSRTRVGMQVEERFTRLRAAANSGEVVDEEELSFAEKSWNSLVEAWGLARMVLPYLIGGIVVVSFVEAYFPPHLVANYLTGTGGVLLASVIGVPTYTPTLVEVILIRALLDLGMSHAAALSFLISAPMVSLPSMMAVARVVGWKLVVTYSVLAIIAASVAGIVYHSFITPF